MTIPTETTDRTELVDQAPGRRVATPDYAAQVTPPPREDVPAKLTENELWHQQRETADDLVESVSRTVTQRDWLLITARLDRTKLQIASDTSLLLLALAWVREKNEHGGASWDRLLDLTDEQLSNLWGYPEGDEPPAEQG